MNVLQKLLLELGRVLFAVTGGKRTHRIGHLVSRWMPNAPQPVAMDGYVLLLDLHHADPALLLINRSIWCFQGKPKVDKSHYCRDRSQRGRCLQAI
jgi:hypothetical protein